MSDDRRLHLRLTRQQLARTLNLAEDVEVVHAYADHATSTVVLVLESEEFGLSAEGSVPPSVQLAEVQGRSRLCAVTTEGCYWDWRRKHPPTDDELLEARADQ